MDTTPPSDEPVEKKVEPHVRCEVCGAWYVDRRFRSLHIQLTKECRDELDLVLIDGRPYVRDSAYVERWRENGKKRGSMDVFMVDEWGYEHIVRRYASERAADAYVRRLADGQK